MANRRFIDFPIAASVGDNDIVLIWQDGLNKQTTKATLLQGSPSSLAGLTDVDIAALTNGQILQYNSTTSKWENVDRTDINLSELGDVTIVAPANGQVLVYNSSTSKWENSSAGYVPYTGAVTTVNLGAQSILAGSFVKAGGTSSQFLKADGSVDSSTYGTGTVTSVALTMPTAFSVANSPITTTGTLAVTATGTTAQYIRGDGSLETFPSLTGFVPYTGATADVNLGTFDLLAERGTFENNGSSNTLTVNHTSGSGYGIIVTKGGNNEALYVSKTSGSGNAMTVVGGRTSLVDLALSSVTNTAGDFLTLSGGVVHKRTAAEVRTDIGAGTVTSVGLSSATSGVTIGSTPVTTSGTITLAIATASGSQNGLLSSTDWTTFNGKQNALTNPVTGTGTTNYVPKFTGSTTIGNSNLINDASGNLGLGVTPSAWSVIQAMQVLNTSYGASPNNLILYQSSNVFYDGAFKYITTGTASQYRINDSGIISWLQAPSGTAGGTITFTQAMTLTAAGRLLINTPTESTFQLDVNGTGRFSGNVGIGGITSTNRLQVLASNTGTQITTIPVAKFVNTGNAFSKFVIGSDNANYDAVISMDNNATLANTKLRFYIGNGESSTAGHSNDQLVLQGNGYFGIGTASPTELLHINKSSGTGAFIRFQDTAGGGVYIGGRSENMELYAGNAEKMRITSGGNVLIGTTTDNGAKLQVSGGDITIANTTTTALRLNPSSSSFQATIYLSEGGTNKWEFGKASTTPNFYIYSYGSSTAVLEFNYSTGAAFFSSLGTGTVTATAGTLSTVSDSSYKVESGYIDSAIDKVLKLKPRYFYWNEKSGLPKDVRQLGFYAQEVNKALGEEAANTPKDKNTPWGISDRSMIAMLTKAIQEQQEIINDLKQKIA
jgi:hypothetical protein